MNNKEALAWLNKNDGILEIKENKEKDIESVSFFITADNCNTTCYIALTGPIDRSYLTRFFNLAVEAFRDE